MAPEMFTFTAPVVSQVSVTLAPGPVEGDGVAVKEVMTGSGIAVTVTVAVAVTEPNELVAVSVYVAVAVGETLCDPVGVTVPTPLLMLTLVELSTTQDSVEDCPLLMLGGVAENWMMRGICPGVTATAMLHELVVPPGPVARTV
jgi:hypothetical protein